MIYGVLGRRVMHTLWNKIQQYITLRIMLVVPFLLLITIAVIITNYFFISYGERTVNELSKQLHTEISHRITQQVSSALNIPHALNQVSANSLPLLDFTSKNSWSPYFWRYLHIQQFSPVYSHFFALDKSGDFFGVTRDQAAQFKIMHRQADTTNDDTLRHYLVNEKGETTTVVQRTPRLNVHSRPWYQQARQKKAPVWSPVYVGFTSKQLQVTAALPVYNADNSLKGVFGSTFFFHHIDNFLRHLKIGKTGEAFIIERSGLLVSTSTLDNVFAIKEGRKTKRFYAHNSPHPLVRHATKTLQNTFSPFSQIHRNEELKFSINDESHFLRVTPINDKRGINWLLVVVIPEKDMVGDIEKTKNRTILLSITIVLLTIIIGLLIVQRIITPIRALNKAAKNLANREWHSTLNIQRKDEIGELAQSFTAMQEQLEASFGLLAKQNEALQEIDQLKDEFLAKTSHELRTPLNGIIGITESILAGVTGALNPALQENLILIVNSGKRLENLVNDLLDFSKLRHHNLALQIKPVSVHSVAQVVLTVSEILLKNKSVEIKNHLNADTALVLADENRLQQIFYNIIGNAIKFTEKGKITLWATARTDSLAIYIEDTGIGIKEENIHSIFKSFEQIEFNTNHRYSGTGLGLAITKELIELQGGYISVCSEHGMGSCFCFTLPLYKGEETVIHTISQPFYSYGYSSSFADVEKEAASIINTEEKQPSTTPKLEILIVDDEPINLQVLTNHLALEDYHITQAALGSEALELLEGNYRPDLVLLDVMMPHMSGYEVTLRIRERYNATELPIILITAKYQVTDLVHGLDSGANDFLPKPFSRDELLARIRTHLNIKNLVSENLRLATELEMTYRLQQMVLPSEEDYEEFPELDIVGFMHATDEVGGDYYDILVHEDKLLVVIADVEGHGLESGVLMLMLQMAIRTLLACDITEPKLMIPYLNHALYNNLKRSGNHKSVTLALLQYNQGALSISGQHEEVIVMRNNGEIECIDTLELGFLLGVRASITDLVDDCHVQLAEGEGFVLYTDGITEAVDKHENGYGLPRLCRMIKTHWHLSAQEIQNQVIADVFHYMGTTALRDDMSLLIFKQHHISHHDNESELKDSI